MSGLALGLIVGLIVVLILLEGKRQERKYGKVRGGSLLGAGMLELQRILEPERKVEILQEEAAPDERPESGDPPEPGPGGP